MAESQEEKIILEGVAYVLRLLPKIIKENLIDRVEMSWFAAF